MENLTPAKDQRVFKSMASLYNYADERNIKLTVMDFDHTNSVVIEHRDGSTFTVTNPHMELVRYSNGGIDETVYIIYSEHHQPFTYMESDLVGDKPKMVSNKPKKGRHVQPAITADTVAKAWAEMYGENFRTEYKALYDILKK
jgi:hypothetical protein